MPYRQFAIRKAAPLPNGKFKTPPSVIRYTNSFRGRLGALIKGAKSSSKAKNLEFSLTLADVQELWEEQGGKCLYTGWTMATVNHDPRLVSIERKDTNVGYVKSNCGLCCWSVNRAKNTLGMEDFLAICQAVHQHTIHLAQHWDGP